jgi:CRISPR-associated protein Cmr6
MSSKQNDPSENVPLMFRAQIDGRCQLQRIEDQNNRYIDQWVQEWTEYYYYPKFNLKSGKPAPKKKPQPVNYKVEPPRFPKNVHCREYKQNWRFLTNSGQDETIARPVFGAKGYPFYPGSSMKGAFRQACQTEAQKERYCGKDLSEEELKKLPEDTPATKPGILRFHGGYPTSAIWTRNCVDIIHAQQEKQVEDDKSSTGANVQIAPLETTWCFGISSPVLRDDDPEWETIWLIWEKALSLGLGSRVSASYGYFKGYSPKGNQKLLEVHLRGSGVASTMLDKTPELRSNTFKAALRGHTLRLLGGMTNAETARALTRKLWGGISSEESNHDEASATVGLLGVFFKEPENYPFIKHKFEVSTKRGKKTISMDRYNFEKSSLILYLMSSLQDQDQGKQILNVATAIVQFAMLLGGFGKSWRRVSHHKFYEEYIAGDPPSKPAIGCHWEFCETSNYFYVPVNKLTDVTVFIDQVRSTFRAWAKQQVSLKNEVASNWREAWFKDSSQQNGVQVWGRIAQNERDSKAVNWFHSPYQGTKSIKENFAGKIGRKGEKTQTGRIWHRMYPLCKNGKLTGEYVELLTIFPDSTQNCCNFLKFLKENKKDHRFQYLW